MGLGRQQSLWSMVVGRRTPARGRVCDPREARLIIAWALLPRENHCRRKNLRPSGGTLFCPGAKICALFGGRQQNRRVPRTYVLTSNPRSGNSQRVGLALVMNSDLSLDFSRVRWNKDGQP